MSNNNTGISSLLSRADSKTVRQYIQFSKRVITGVTIAVTIICGGAILLCYEAEDTQSVVGLVTSYTNFATIAFVSYSINSIGDKILRATHPDFDKDDDEEDNESEDENG